MDDNIFLTEMLNYINNLNDEIYKKHHLVKIDRTSKNKRKKVDSTNKSNADVVLLDNRIKNYNKKVNSIEDMKSNKGITELNIEPNKESDKIEEYDKIEWKNLDINVKIEEYNKYINKCQFKNFPEELNVRIMSLIRDGSLDKKKYIVFTDHIVDIPLIKYDNNNYEYYLTIDRVKKKKVKMFN